MDAHERYREGDLRGAVEAQIEHVRTHPTDARGRSFLFGLCCVEGDLERAERQLEALGSLDPSLDAGLQVYRHLLHSEAARRDAWRGVGSPMLPPNAPAECELRLQAFTHYVAGALDEAARLFEEAAEQAPLLPGKLNGEPFDALREGDDLLASVLEVYAGGRYLWVPWSRIHSLEVREPASVTDLLWAPARLVDTDGTEASVYLPAIYVGSYGEDEPKLRLGRSTAWQEAGPCGARGLGQRLLLAYRGDDEREEPLLGIRHLEIGS